LAGELERVEPTAADIAQKEAARQAVILAFGLAGALLMIPVYKRIAHAQADALRQALPHDPVMREVEQKQAAAAAARTKIRHWHKVAGLLWPVSSSAAMWALRRAENVSKRSRKADSR
jgi:hypothetical protein